MRYLLDTNVLSEGVKRRPDPGVASWLVQHEAGAAISETGTGNTRAVILSDLYPVSDPAHPFRFMRLEVTR